MKNESCQTISAIIPARNEAKSIERVVSQLIALQSSSGSPLLHEVIVADNGSTDATADLAIKAGAKVVDVMQIGYGHACWQAAQNSCSEILLFVDGDGAADSAQAPLLLNAIAKGADLVIGVRQDIEPHAMTFSQTFGNGLACLLVRIIWGVPVSDLGPYRAIRREAFEQLQMQDRHYGWTIEMQIRAYVLGLRVKEVPVRWLARTSGYSKISGNFSGVVGAAYGILGMIAKLWWQERSREKKGFLKIEHFLK